jgi:Raf kinase inhibitor-like YbhB/YbcL family protein
VYSRGMRAAWLLQGLGYFILIGAAWYLFAQHQQAATTPNSPAATTSEQPATDTTMILRSPAFGHEEVIPSKYTCDGDDMSPPLAIDKVPEGTVSLALIMDDPDAPAGVWDHWVVFNIPATVSRIGEGEEPPGVHGKGTSGNLTYHGPCPPDREHRYLFKVYALDTQLDLPEGVSKAEVLYAMEGHVLESTTLMGRYERVSSTQ